MKQMMTQDLIEKKIYLIRGQRVMLDRDLATLYGVATRVLNQAVKRNIDRFPKDFMFQLTREEMKNWMSQIVISNKEKMGLRKQPYVFTEPGVAMLSSVLDSKIAIQVNIQIIRTFIKLREILSTHTKLAYKLKELEKKIEKHDAEIQGIFEAIRQMMIVEEKPKREMGFRYEKR